MLAAQEKNPFVVMGNDSRDIDYETTWRAHLAKVARKKQVAAGAGLRGGWGRWVAGWQAP
jgi:hypothetical protein